MPSTHIPPGSADVQGDLWGARPEAWSEHEPQGTPLFEAVLESAGVRPGTRLLDLGCATGTLCRRAVDRGAVVAGLDAAEPLVEIARRKVPEGDFRRGDVQFLPYEDAAFDVVTAVNSIQFAADVTETLREARRVVRPGGAVTVAVWGAPEDVDLLSVVRVVAALAPGPASSRPLLEPGALEASLAEVGLDVREARAGVSSFRFTGEGEMLRQLTAAGGVVRVIRAVEEDAVHTALLEAMERFRGDDGSYRLDNAWRVVVAIRGDSSD